MNYGCIGEKLCHSFSKEIHNSLADYTYELCELAYSELDSFFSARDFKAINVTIPYKELVIPHLYFIDSFAKEIGAVNTVVNRDGKLYGYNTDFYGMESLIRRIGIDISGKKVVILGSGGTSKTAYAVARHLGAGEIIKVSRTAREECVSYEELYTHHTDAEVIINTTPVGMYPDIFGVSAELDKFPALLGVCDVVYNPLRTPLVCEAKRRGILSGGGLYMLVAQAVRASETFLDTSYPDGTVENIYRKTLRDKENIVLVGMPSSGKSTVGKILAKELGRSFVDTDVVIEEKAKRAISDIILTDGECAFRDMEASAVKAVSSMTGAVIATGGGAVLRKENVNALSENGRIYFIDRPFEELVPTSSRPLSSDIQALKKRYNERYGIYSSVCDVHIKADRTAAGVAEMIMENFTK